VKRWVVASLWVLLSFRAAAHSVSDAYLTLTAGEPGVAGVVHGQWDIALRDLDFVLDLNSAGNGQLTWGEVRRRRAQIENYAYAHLRFESDGAQRCAIKPGRMMIDEHADGAYAVLLFDVSCAAPQSRITLNYDLFFGIDPSHRAIFVMRAGADIATAVLSPQNFNIALH
jgi:hypothetical protein